MSAVVKVVKIEADDLKLKIKPVEVWGDNPHFFAQQVEEQLASVAESVRKAFTAIYGEQA